MELWYLVVGFIVGFVGIALSPVGFIGHKFNWSKIRSYISDQDEARLRTMNSHLPDELDTDDFKDIHRR